MGPKNPDGILKALASRAREELRERVKASSARMFCFLLSSKLAWLLLFLAGSIQNEEQHELRFYGRGRVKERGSKVFTSFKIILCHYKSDKHYC